MATSTKYVGLSLGADICWPIAYESLFDSLTREGLKIDGQTIEFAVERVTIEPFSLHQPVKYDVVIDRLRMDWLPTPVAAAGFSSPEVYLDDIRVRPSDGALRRMDDLTYQGMKYTLEVDIAELDMGALLADVFTHLENG